MCLNQLEAVLGHIGNNTSTLGRYEIVKHLARGGMAEVFLARATGIEGFERHVVIKRIRAEQAHDKSHVQMFLEEARLAATLHHHNIVQVHDIGEQQGEYFFVMEYVHGEDVRTLLAEVSRRGERTPLEHVLTIITAAAAGLHHAHEQCGPNRVPLGIVHRDVSPENILIGYDGGVKVADFGIAKATHRTLRTESGIRKGKVPYMSPEQCVGLPTDRRSDIFALGIVLYESLTMRRLFDDDNDFLTMTAIVQSLIPPPSKVCPEIPPELEAIAMKALAPLPDERYATADHLRLALEAFAAKVGLRTSTTALADYMKAQFGRRVEPWLAEDDEPEIELSIDFDCSGAGSAPVSRDAIRTLSVPRVLMATPASPLVVAHGTKIPGAPGPADESFPLGWQAALAPASSTHVVLPRPHGHRSRWFAASVGAALAIAAAIILVSARSSSSAIPLATEILPASPPGPSVPAPVIEDPPASPPGPRASPPVAEVLPTSPSGPGEPARIVAPVPPAGASGGSATSPAPELVHALPVKKRHHSPRPGAAKKHWDPHTLFPQ
jgi:serine/threonine protein kinase